mgnify:FL=1
MKEEWIEIQHEKYKPNSIVAVSNTGKVKHYDGTITETSLRMSTIRYEGKLIRIHRLIAMLFIPKTEEDIKLGRNTVDHITHNPIDMNVNDVRNLRWCTIKENNNFDEAVSNKNCTKRNEKTCNKLKNRKFTDEWRRKISESRKGKSPWNKGMKGTDYMQHFKNGINNQYNLSVQEN